MQRLFHLILILITHQFVQGQIQHQAVFDRAERVDSLTIWMYEYQAMGPKPIGSSTIDTARFWIAKKLENLGYVVHYDTFTKSGAICYNIIVEKQGDRPDEWVVVGGHYDTVWDSPGANDNGSGVVALLHIASQVKTADTRYGIRIIFFSAEETGLQGSQHYVSNTLPASDSVIVMFNLDQLGGTAGYDNSSIYCERDEDDVPSTNNAASWRITDTLAMVMEAYTDLTPVISEAYSSDYMPFEQEGITITGLYQHSGYPFYHTSGDILANVDTNATKEVIKGAIAATLVFAKMKELVNIDERSISSVFLVPNPAVNTVTLRGDGLKTYRVEIINVVGVKVLQAQVRPGESIAVSELKNGMYHVMILSDDFEPIQATKLIIAH